MAGKRIGDAGGVYLLSVCAHAGELQERLGVGQLEQSEGFAVLRRKVVISSLRVVKKKKTKMKETIPIASTTATE